MFSKKYLHYCPIYSVSIHSVEETLIPGKGRALLHTDIAVEAPPGCYVRIAPRSGLAFLYGLDIGAGVIDADYRGNIGILVFNHGIFDYTGMRLLSRN